MSDFWLAYLGIPRIKVVPRYKHERVNHSKEFVRSDGVHTNNIEATWAALKSKITKKRCNEKFLQEGLFEQMWRSKNKGELWPGLLEALRTVKYE